MKLGLVPCPASLPLVNRLDIRTNFFAPAFLAASTRCSVPYKASQPVLKRDTTTQASAQWCTHVSCAQLRCSINCVCACKSCCCSHNATCQHLSGGHSCFSSCSFAGHLTKSDSTSRMYTGSTAMPYMAGKSAFAAINYADLCV